MARIVFGGEFGANLGHIYPMLRLANALHIRGHEIVFVCRDVETAHDAVKEKGYSLIQGPVWKNPPLKNIRKIPTPSYADVIARQGFGFKQKLRSMLSAWDDCLAFIKPDLIIADHSPGLSLAVRNTIPMINLGNGFTLPPSEIEEFPNIITSGSPLVSQQNLLQMFNELQDERMKPRLERLPQIFDTEGQFVCTLPQLDPYTEFRKTPVIGPLEDCIAPSPRPISAHIFVYLANEAQDRDTVLESVRSVNLPATAFIRGGQPTLIERFQSEKLKILTSPVEFSEILPTVSLVVHSGGGGTATSCLMAGRPQILLPRQSETGLTARLIEKQGLGRSIKRGASIPEISKMIEGVLNDQDMSARCALAAKEISNGDWGNAADKIVARAEELMR